MIGKTNSSQGVSSIPSEYVNIRMMTNQASHGDLVGAKFVLSYEKFSQEYVWGGSEMTLQVPAYVVCTIEWGDVEGYKKPEAVTFTTVEDNARTIEVEYQCELLTVNVSADQGVPTGFEISILKADDTIGNETKYTRLEYIQSSGTQYVDTGFKPSSNTRIVIDMEPTSSSTGFLFGARVNSSANAQSKSFSFVNISGTSLRSDFGSVENSINMSPLQRLTIDKNKNVTTVNGQSVTATSQTFSSSYNLYLLTVNTAGAAGAYVAAKIYSCKIYDNGVLIRDYIPVKDSNGVAGLYDVVNDAFYASSGSEGFIASEEISEVIGVQTSASGMYKIPFGESYNIEASDIDGFETPEPVSRVASEKEFVATMEYKAVGVKDLSLMDVYGNKIQRSTANCYVVREAGQYKFPVVYGNAIKNGKVNTAAFTNNGGTYSHDFVWEYGIITQPYIDKDIEGKGYNLRTYFSNNDADGVISDFAIVDGSPCKFVQFTVENIPTTGANVILSVTDGIYIVWSWHIWLWPHDLSPVEITNATGVKYKIMPVNLASKYDSDGIHIKNWFYQFGRPNPMLCPSSYNSTSNHASFGVLSYAAASIASNIQTGIKNPATFYKYSSSYNYNWFQTNSGKTYNLWDAACTGTGNSDNDTVKTVYDPCPVGWKVPNGNTFTGFIIINDMHGIVKFTRYIGDSTGVGFPMSGYRSSSDGSPNDVGSVGYVWLSSARSQNHAYYLSFGSSYVYPQYSNRRASGFSVRPVQDDNIQLDVIMISFLLIGSTERAEAGMTWFEWINSEYSDGYYMPTSDGYVQRGGYLIKDDTSGAFVRLSDNIIGGRQYLRHV